MSNCLFQIRLYQDSDFAALEQIEQQAFQYPQSSSQLASLLQDRENCWVVEKNQCLIGFAIWRVIVDEAELLNIAVVPEFQGTDVAKALLSHNINELKNKHVVAAFLEVRESNQRAIGFYQGKGFGIIGRRKNYYSNGISPSGVTLKESAIQMRIEL